MSTAHYISKLKATETETHGHKLRHQALDPWDSNNPPGVPASDVVGKVVMRIPWFGWITLFMRDNSWGLPVVIAHHNAAYNHRIYCADTYERKNLNNRN